MKLKSQLCLCFLVLCCLTSTVFAENKDIWYSDYVTKVTEMGIMQESFKDFEAEETISNAEFVSAILKLVGIKTAERISDMDYARKQGYILPDEMSDDGAPITRQNIAKIISRVLKLPDIPIDEISSQISDWDNTCPKCKSDIIKCYKYGIMSGYEDKSFRGRYTATRAEVAVILVKAYNYKGVANE